MIGTKKLCSGSVPSNFKQYIEAALMHGQTNLYEIIMIISIQPLQHTD